MTGILINIYAKKSKDNLTDFVISLFQLVGANKNQKRLSCSDILLISADHIQSMTSHQAQLEQEKKDLMVTRTKLFESFTKKLDGLPVAVKKKAVMVTFGFKKI